MADGQNECPGKFPFKYEPQWEGPLPGPSFEKQTEDALNGLYCRITKIGGAVPSDDPPKAPGTAAPGVSELYSRGDHVHPRQTNVVDLTSKQTVTGAKTFSQGPFGASAAVAAAQIDLAQGVVFSKTIDANTAFTFIGVPAGAAATFSLILTNGGAYTVTWPASVRWEGGEAPELTASGEDLLTFLTPDGGGTWYGVLSIGDAR